MSSDDPKRDLITKNLRIAYGAVVAEPIPDRLKELLRRIDGGDDDPDSGIGAEPPKPHEDGPKPNGAAAAVKPPTQE